MKRARKSTSCAICLHTHHANDYANLRDACYCGERFCYICPSVACACVDDDPAIQALKERLRPAAIERAALRSEAELMGQSALSDSNQARLLLLKEIVESLSREIVRLEERREGWEYDDDELMPAALHGGQGRGGRL